MYKHPIEIQLKETRLPLPALAFVQIVVETLLCVRPPVFPLDGVEDGVVVFVFIRNNPTLVCFEVGCAIWLVSVLIDELGGSLYTHLQLLRQQSQQLVHLQPFNPVSRRFLFKRPLFTHHHAPDVVKDNPMDTTAVNLTTLFGVAPDGTIKVTAFQDKFRENHQFFI